VKVIHYLPAHPSYFPEDNYTQEEVERGVAMFRHFNKPGLMGEIPEEFIFLTQAGKSVTSVFDSKEMGSPDEKTATRWTKNTLEFAESDLIRYVREIRMCKNRFHLH
jgi:hypothetical protein